MLGVSCLAFAVRQIPVVKVNRLAVTLAYTVVVLVGRKERALWVAKLIVLCSSTQQQIRSSRLRALTSQGFQALHALAQA
jgi:hypothetical protein